MTPPKFSLATLNGEKVEELNTAEIAATNAELDGIAIDGDAISRLAKLGMLDYDRERKNAAADLRIRPATLDRLVEAKRPKQDNDTLQGTRLELTEPEPWPDAVNGPGLFAGLSKTIRRHVVMDEAVADTIALWVAHTYALDAFGISPRLGIKSPEKGCGKTTLIDVLKELVWRPLPFANASIAAIFRIVEQSSPTLLMDEAETFLKDNEEMRGILNSAHRRGQFVLRTVGEDLEPRAFSTWSAGAIALIGSLPGTLEDRAISVELRRKTPSETNEPFRFDRVSHLTELASKVARWTRDNVERIKASDPATPGLFNRVADNWRPLFSIAEVAGGDWLERARRAARIANESDAAQSYRVMLLEDIRTIFSERGVESIPSGELASTLAAIESRPWGEYRHGKAISANGVARLLKPYGISPDNRRDGDKVLKGYHLAQFGDAFSRYLAPEVNSNRYNATSLQPQALPGDFQPLQIAERSGCETALQPNNHGHCSGVADADDADSWQFNKEAGEPASTPDINLRRACAR